VLNLTDNERRVLARAEFAASTPATELARELGLKGDTVRSVLDRLRARGIIAPAYRIDDTALGLQVYVVLISFTVHGLMCFDEVVEYLSDQPSVISIGEICGDYDLILEFAVENKGYIDRAFLDMSARFGGILWRTAILRAYYMYAFERKYLAETVTEVPPRFVVYGKSAAPQKYDELDVAILNELRRSPSTPARQLALAVGAPPQSVHYRMTRLTSNGVLLGMGYFLNPYLLGIQSYVLMLKVSYYNHEVEEKLLNYCMTAPNVVAMGRRTGDWDYILDIEVSHPKQLQVVRKQVLATIDTTLVDFSLHVFHQYLKNV
jgi:Lrp/AsnC family transcriptional regulator